MNARSSSEPYVPRFLYLLVVLVLVTSLTGTIGLMTQVAASDEFEVEALLPWVVVGLLLGLAIWFVLDAPERQRRSRRKQRSRAERREPYERATPRDVRD